MAELDFEVTDEVDITDKVCPLTFVKAKVAIEELEDGEILAVRMNDGEPVQNVPRSMKEEGRFWWIFIQIPVWHVKSWHRFSEMRKMIMRIRLKYIK